MRLSEFADLHGPALERDEVKYNLILGLLGRIRETEPSDVRLWTLGAPGECAMQTPGYPLILGRLSDAQCSAFADATRDLDYPGVVGIDDTPCLFVERASARGVTFAEPIPQTIHALRRQPAHPEVPGEARLVERDDIKQFSQWLLGFFQEAVPHEPVPPRERIETTAASGSYRFWTVDGTPVAMAGIVRRTRRTAAIAGVYTPPALRNRGYAGAVTAAVADAIFAEGRAAACLYTDLRNPASNRCYAKIGFEPACRAWHYLTA